MFLSLPPAPPLAGLVQAYWFVQDLPGVFAGQTIRTSPIPLAVLSVNMGRPNATRDGALVPRVSMLGLQSRVREWRSWSETCFMMAMLTVPGVLRLFPHVQAGGADCLADLGALAGDAAAASLAGCVDAQAGPVRTAAQIDRWLLARLDRARCVPEGMRVAAAHAVLRAGGRVEQAAQAAQTDRRQLQRWFHRHLGVGPKEMADLERLHRSLRDVQSGRGDPLAGFSDQAHQIRNWRRRLGVTPGSYARGGGSALAAQFRPDAGTPGPAFYL